MNIKSIELDASIQCRSVIDTATVGEYAERMEAGDDFPPVILFGTANKCWIGDGWHRVLAASQIKRTEIAAEIRKGGRAEALRYALGANAANGLRRTNADKRRCVEIALKEFGSMSSRQIAEMCGVSDKTVEAVRPRAEIPHVETRTDTLGRNQPATRTSKPTPTPTPTYTPSEPAPFRSPSLAATTPPPPASAASKNPNKLVLAPPSNGMQFVRMAIMDMEQIRKDDTEREQAFKTIKEWIQKNENR